MRAVSPADDFVLVDHADDAEDSDDYSYDDVADAEAAEGRPPLSEQEQLSRAILESAREAGRLHNEDADWDAAAGDEALAARLGREHDEHVAHHFASVDKAKAAPSSLARDDTDLEIAMALQDDENARAAGGRAAAVAARRDARARRDRAANELAALGEQADCARLARDAPPPPPPPREKDEEEGEPSLNISPAFWSATRSSPAAARPPRAPTERGSPPQTDSAEDLTFVITQTAKFSTIDLSARLARGLGAD